MSTETIHKNHSETVYNLDSHALPAELIKSDPDFADAVDGASLMLAPGARLFERAHTHDPASTELADYIKHYESKGQYVHAVRVNQKELDADLSWMRLKDPEVAEDLEGGLDAILLFAMKPNARQITSQSLQLYETHQRVPIEALVSRNVPTTDAREDW